MGTFVFSAFNKEDKSVFIVCSAFDEKSALRYVEQWHPHFYGFSAVGLIYDNSVHCSIVINPKNF